MVILLYVIMIQEQYKVKPEYTGERDLEFSMRHRAYGFSVPCVDIDFLLVEYDFGVPKALIEYKRWNAKVDFYHNSIKAVKALADNSQLPFFVVYYLSSTWNFYVVPVNNYAKHIVNQKRAVVMSEKNFVRMLYFLRNKEVPGNILESLCSSKLPEDIKLPEINI